MMNKKIKNLIHSFIICGVFHWQCRLLVVISGQSRSTWTIWRDEWKNAVRPQKASMGPVGAADDVIRKPRQFVCCCSCAVVAYRCGNRGKCSEPNQENSGPNHRTFHSSECYLITTKWTKNIVGLTQHFFFFLPTASSSAIGAFNFKFLKDNFNLELQKKIFKRKNINMIH